MTLSKLTPETEWALWGLGTTLLESPLYFQHLQQCWACGRSPFWLATNKTLLLLSHQSCPTLCNPIDGSPLGSPVPGILQARTLEWAAVSFSNAWKWKVKVRALNLGWLLATPWTAAYQAPPSMGFSRQECWSEVPLPSPTNKMLDKAKYNWVILMMLSIFSWPTLKCLNPVISNQQKNLEERAWL